MQLAEVNAEIGLPWGLGKVGGTWRPDEAERSASWELLVELTTRVSLSELPPGEGLLRESLSSLHALFGLTRASFAATVLLWLRPDLAATRRCHSGCSPWPYSMEESGLYLRTGTQRWRTMKHDVLRQSARSSGSALGTGRKNCATNWVRYRHC